jgi:hypothetical protein
MKRIVKGMFRRLGYEIRRLSPSSPDAFSEQKRLLDASSPAVIFDVGAHHGETALAYRKLFPTAIIYCFEPFQESFAILQATLAESARVRLFNSIRPVKDIPAPPRTGPATVKVREPRLSQLA